jgi:hypothetical protein
VRALDQCWRGNPAGRSDATSLLDLSEVTSIDAAGHACLAALHRQGAEFVAADCLTRAIVDEITRGDLPDRACPGGSGERRPEPNRGAT